ncbi:hypothetical protein HYDPIDRAFT_115975 [Hydnomerulius pinastri MD-312]|uniref:Unplaced genomic scaffold scaffold_28, whole genome shotgun sequence n=1 Tax=Hydnomerulius pinastri MD-312 TaxID=994086 RepID=A0A0C9V750_9AGAM|nr:hypothetical protein HYDPIDRAFT_115975 [Hydnomerulius pinastri MD-312]
MVSPLASSGRTGPFKSNILLCVLFLPFYCLAETLDSANIHIAMLNAAVTLHARLFHVAHFLKLDLSHKASESFKQY